MFFRSVLWDSSPWTTAVWENSFGGHCFHPHQTSKSKYWYFFLGTNIYLIKKSLLSRWKLFFPRMEINSFLVIQSDLFGMVKWPFQGVKWPPTRRWKGHFESPGWLLFQAIFVICKEQRHLGEKPQRNLELPGVYGNFFSNQKVGFRGFDGDLGISEVGSVGNPW